MYTCMGMILRVQPTWLFMAGMSQRAMFEDTTERNGRKLSSLKFQNPNWIYTVNNG